MIAARGPLATIGLVAAVVGIAVSAYLTVAHYSGVAPACVTTGAIDCGAVTSSSYSLVPGTAIPITIAGIAFFAASAAAFAVAGTAAEPEWVPLAHFVLAAAGLAAVLYLVYAELVVIARICEWCTLVHALVLLTFVLALRRLQAA